MALKDWKKYKSKEEHVLHSWRNRKNKHETIIEYHDGKYIFWEFSKDGASDIHVKYGLTTKKQALRYARAYMRKH